MSTPERKTTDSNNVIVKSETRKNSVLETAQSFPGASCCRAGKVQSINQSFYYNKA